MKPRLFAVLCLLLTGIQVTKNVFAQRSEFTFPKFQHITTNDGLSNNSAYMLMQDHRGFIWIATNYGLNRFDGNEFKTYNYNYLDSNSISADWYRSLFEDKRGNIWASTSTQGFFVFNPKTEKFTRFRYQQGNTNSLSGDIADANMVMDSAGIIWIGTSCGLNSFNPDNKTFELFTHRNKDNTSLSSDKIIWLCVDDENNLWIITSANSVDVFNVAEKRVCSRYWIGSVQMPGNKNKPSLYTIQKGENGNIWIASEFNGLYNYNTRTKSWKHFCKVPGNKYSLTQDGISAVNEDPSGNLFVTGIDSGLYYYESASDKFYFSPVTKEKGVSFNSILKDRNGKIWLSGGDAGVYVSDPQTKKFQTVGVNSERNYPLNSNFIVGFYRSARGDLFVNGQNGVYTFDHLRNSIKPFKLFENRSDIFNSNITWMIRQDEQEVLWFCTLNGLVSYNTKSGDHHLYIYNEKNPSSMGAPSVTGFVVDNNGRYWVSTFGGGLNLFDPSTGKFMVYKVHNGSNSISTNYVHGIFKDSHGIIYLGSWYGGLIQFNPTDTTFKIFKHNPSDASSLSCDITWPLYEDSNGIMWIGTVGGGLNAFDPTKGKFKTFDVKDGLPSNAVVSLVNDNLGNTWLGTYHGITMCLLPKNPFDNSTKITFRNYDMNDGLPSNDCYFLGAHKDPDGTLYFSTSTGGFFYFKPNELKDNDYIPPVFITSVSLMNKPIDERDSGSVLKTASDFAKEIKLNYKQNIISFTFAALNYIHPEKNKYAYKMEGYDKEWIFTSAENRFANYTNLNSGEYIFKVKGSNNDGLWNETPTELIITITPPFWREPWFNIVVVLLIISSIYTFYRYRITQILALQRLRNKIASDLHDDIGSTLNSISVYCEVARKDVRKRDHALSMIGESSRNIIDSLSDIVWTINPENDNFDKIIFRMRTLAYNLMKAKQIDCVFRADNGLNELKLPMEIRRNIYLIYKEALNNLIKYANASRASILISNEQNQITFIIRDDGVGFNVKKHYNGNGLKNMKCRAEEINAKLVIESIIGTGTTVELNLMT